MPHLRQLVIAAKDPSRLSSFYQEVFELEKIEEAKGATFLSDGTFNLAVVLEAGPHKQGFRHLSFDTARPESIRKKLAHVNALEANLVETDSTTGTNHELRDPDGNTIGLCHRAFDVGYEQRPVPIRHNRSFVDFRFRRLHQFGASLSKKRGAAGTQSFRVFRQKQR